MRHIELMRKLESAKVDRMLSRFRNNPNSFAGQIVSAGLHSETERHACVMIESPVDLDPTSPTFGQLVSIVGLTDPGSFVL
jgi:hypothetical protein